MDSRYATICNESFAFASAEGVDALQERIGGLETELVNREKKVEQAKQQQPFWRKRHRSLSEYAAEQRENFVVERLALIDAALANNDAIPECTREFEVLQNQEKFLYQVIEHLVEVVMQQAERDVLVASLGAAKIREELVRTKALLSYAKRNTLLKPLLLHEKQVKIEGGLSEALSQAAMDAAAQVRQLTDAIKSHDERIAQIRANK